MEGEEEDGGGGGLDSSEVYEFMILFIDIFGLWFSPITRTLLAVFDSLTTDISKYMLFRLWFWLGSVTTPLAQSSYLVLSPRAGPGGVGE